ncbi:tetratricopeptide (TPR) repeat protein [Streptomyces sp. SAI-135]|uniref:tetratricopeptide repeat protein n=1 Tax=unclassified Streptomyces TaxID=2593676 RepID=UPI002474381D|nr:MULTISPECIES: tetratricopeptide repeat protein [unclassified Streptomyces]MDH6516247.1 tetratricopeptide (TPR) repeat protein [Streptomyces sp. SAI-090]MDH6619662.1 tetratricopeptide (TPR) repeat protein [Streptomyces sp. SAI-135]
MSGVDGSAAFDALRRAMAENAEEPEGPARNARAEQLLAEAEKLNIPLAVIEALGHQLKVYNYSSEKAKMFVPFARLLRMWDERPEDFDEYETHSLHWVFKWMTTGMLDQPHIPLAAMEKWLGEMEHRYRLAGHSERAVRSAEYSVAAHVGDLERAERAYAAWLAADRDAMADCHACELHEQGWWQSQRGRDAEALDLWAPVLEGAFTCAHEPHAVLASSLKPLLRLGRLDEARANHLRGFRLVRSMESMRGAYADHVEFCALSGNEARALELLAERPAYFTDDGHPRSRLDFTAVVALLTDRLTELGLGERPVPGPAGRSWTAAELAAHARGEALALAARFDERNGTAHVSEQVRARMAQRPLVERLPLGVRAVRTVAAPVPVPAAPATAGEPDLPALVAEARRLSDTLRPNAVEAWAAVARAAEGVELDPRDRAEVADHEAMDRGPEGLELFERAAELYAEAGDPGEALAARARAAYVRALAGEVDAALAAVAGPYDEVLALYSADETGVGQTASVLMSRARILMRRLHESDDAACLAEAESAVREVLALVEGRAGDDVRLAARVAEAQAMLAEQAARTGDLPAAAELFERAAAGFVAAGVPWFAVEYEARLAGLLHHLGDLDGTERALRAALEHGGSHLEAVGRAQLHLQLAEVVGGRGLAGEAAEHALEAAHWADEAGQGPTLGALARHQLGGFLLGLGRWAEAAEVLEAALPDLSAERHGEGTVVQTQWWLGDCLSELGEHREAAERRLQAAEIARHWPEQHDHATLAHLAAESLGAAGLPAEADRAYARAGALWRELGHVHGLVRSLRARAWLALRTQDGADAARQLMADAVRECETALGDASADEETRQRLVGELGHTHRQFGDLLARSVPEDAEDDSIRAVLEEALAEVVEAVVVFASLGDGALDARTGAELAAGWLAADLSRPAEAAARARAVLDAYGDAEADDGTAQSRRDEARRLLGLMEEQDG